MRAGQLRIAKMTADQEAERDVAGAQLALDQDELEDAQGDLGARGRRSGGSGAAARGGAA